MRLAPGAAADMEEYEAFSAASNLQVGVKFSGGGREKGGSGVYLDLDVCLLYVAYMQRWTSSYTACAARCGPCSAVLPPPTCTHLPPIQPIHTALLHFPHTHSPILTQSWPLIRLIHLQDVGKPLPRHSAPSSQCNSSIRPLASLTGTIIVFGFFLH